MDTFTIAVYLASNFVVMLAYERAMGAFFEKRRTASIILVLSCLLYFALSSAVFLLWSIPIVNMSVTIIAITIITLNYEASAIKRIVAVVGSYVIIATTDFLAALIIGIYQVDHFDSLGDYNYNILGFILLGALAYILALLLRRFKNIRKNTIKSLLFLILYSSILVSSVVVLLIGLSYFPQSIAIIFIIVIFGINVFMYYIHDILSAAYEDKLKAALHTQEKEYYFTQCQLMQESVENIKTIRHDMKLHLAIARDYTARGKANDATDYLDGLLGDIEKKEVYSNTKNTAFDSIINYKLNDAKQENIKLDIRLLIPPALNMEVADVVTILGNLLDNAIEANAKAEDKVIKLDIEYSKESLFIHVENTFDGVVKYAQGKSGAEKIITTRKDSDNHGYGLKNIRNSVEKYNGHVDISHDNNIFSVGVLLYVNEE